MFLDKFKLEILFDLKKGPKKVKIFPDNKEAFLMPINLKKNNRIVIRMN